MSGRTPSLTAHTAPSGKSIPGSRGTVPCTCRRAVLGTEATIRNGLRLIRLRFGLHRSELPSLETRDLKVYLLSLLAGPGVSCFNERVRRFPRLQRGEDKDGFPIFHRLSRSDRWCLAHSVASLARNLPSGCAKHAPSSEHAFFTRATQTIPKPADPSYVQFVRREVSRMFPHGWDRRVYPSSVESFAPKYSSRFSDAYNNKASDIWASYSSKTEFLNATLNGVLPQHLGGDRSRPRPFWLSSLDAEHDSATFALRYKEVPTAGKVRPLGIPTEDYDLLGPLHRAMYSHLSGLDWLVRGEVTTGRVAKVCVGTTQTSIDLVNATDGLSLEVSEAILSKCLSKASIVPGRVREWASRSLRSTLCLKGKKGRSAEVTEGQMMGTYLSFPLLCIHSYLAAKWATRNSRMRGIMVNGDDVVVSHDDPIGEYPQGYELNRKKTCTGPNVAELNSTVFLRAGGRWKKVRNLRRGGAETDYAGIRHMAGACQSAGPSWVSAFIRSKIGKKWELTPEVLGLSRHHALVYHYGSRQRGRGATLVAPVEVSDRYVNVTVEPSRLQKIAFSYDLFNVGRSGSEPDPFNPSRSAVLRSRGAGYSLRRFRHRMNQRVFGQSLSYSFWKAIKSPRPKRVWQVLSSCQGPEWEREEETSRESVCPLNWVNPHAGFIPVHRSTLLNLPKQLFRLGDLLDARC